MGSTITADGFFRDGRGSNTFVHLISSTVTIPNLEVLYKALSVLLFPSEDSQGLHEGAVLCLCPAVHATWVQDPMTYFFVRLHPRLRHRLASMGLDGSLRPLAGSLEPALCSPIMLHTWLTSDRL